MAFDRLRGIDDEAARSRLLRSAARQSISIRRLLFAFLLFGMISGVTSCAMKKAWPAASDLEHYVSMAAVFIFVGILFRWRAQRVDRTLISLLREECRCESCGYPRAADAAACPECGTALDPAAAE